MTAANGSGDAPVGVPGGTNGQPPAAIVSESLAEPTPPNESATPETLEDLKKVKGENAQLRARLKQVDEKEQAAQLAAMSELEKTQTQLAKAAEQVAQYKNLYAETLVRLEASSLGFANPEIGAQLVTSKLEFGDDGRPTNARALLEALLKTDGYLKAPAQDAGAPTPPTRAPLGATNHGRQAGGQPTMEDFRQGRLSAADAARMWDSGDMTKLLQAEADRVRNQR